MNSTSMQRLGGLARSAKMTPEQRSECARKAAIARWQKEEKPKRRKLAVMRGQMSAVRRQMSANIRSEWEPVMIPGCDTCDQPADFVRGGRHACWSCKLEEDRV